MYTKEGKPFVLSPYMWQGKVAPHPPLTNFVIYPLCFTAYAFCDVTSQLFSLKGGGASDQKTHTSTTPTHLKLTMILTSNLQYTRPLKCNLFVDAWKGFTSNKLYGVNFEYSKRGGLPNGMDFWHHLKSEQLDHLKTDQIAWMPMHWSGWFSIGTVYYVLDRSFKKHTIYILPFKNPDFE